MAILSILTVWLLAVAPAPDVSPPQIQHTPCSEYPRGQSYTIRVEIRDDSALFDPKILYRLRPARRWQSLPLQREENTTRYSATIPARELNGVLEYFVQTFDEHGNGPALFASAEAPAVVRPKKDAAICTQVTETTPAEVMVPPVAVAANPTVPPTSSEQTIIAAPVTDTAEPPPWREPAGPPGSCDGPGGPWYCEHWVWWTAGGVLAAAAVTLVVVLARPDETPRPSEAVIQVGGPPPWSGSLTWRP